jgi:hemolysin activation/secretion protein
MSTDHRAAARRQLRRLLTAVLVAVSVCATAFAAPVPPVSNDDQNLRARQEDQQRRQRDRQKDVFLQKGRQASRDTSLPDETPSFPIKNLVLAGDSAARFPWAQAMLDAYAGRSIGAKGLALIVKRLTAAFIDCGYITTLVTVPEQDLSSGTVTLVLVPGRIGAFRFAADGVAGNWRTAFPVRPGDILNLRDLEQGLEQLKRVPSQDGVTMQIVPGEKSGESDIVISLPAAKRWRQTTRIDDSGIAPTGKYGYWRDWKSTTRSAPTTFSPTPSAAMATAKAAGWEPAVQ